MSTKTSKKSFWTRTAAVFMVAMLLVAAMPATSAFAAIGAPVSVGQNSTTTAGTTLAVTVPAAGVAVGNTVIITFAMDPQTGTVSAADTRGNTYTNNLDIANGSGTAGVRTVVLSAQVTTALTSTNTITVTSPSSAVRAMSVYAVTGLWTALPVDKTATGTGNSTAPLTSATAATAQANELLIGAMGWEGRTSSTTFTAGTSYTALTEASAIALTSGTSVTISPEYRIVSATGAYTASGTLSNGRNWAAAIVTYKERSATTTTLTAPTAVTYGAPVTFTATVSPTPTNGVTVNFFDGATLIGSGTTAAGVATYTTTPANQLSASASPHSVTATFVGNASFAASTSAAGSQVVNKKALTMSGLSVPSSKVYNGNTAAVVSGTPALQGAEAVGAGNTSDGKPYSGDAVSITGTAAGTYNSKTVAAASSVTFSGLSLTGLQSGNYSLTIQSPASATITAFALTGNITASGKIYDGNNSAAIATRTLTGVISPDVVSYVGGTATFDDKNVGTGKAVSASGLSLSGADAGNYSVNTSAGTMADITPVALIGHITADNKTYDGNDSAVIATRTLDGVLGTEVVSYTGGTATFNDKNVGTGKAVSAIGLGLSGADAGNYTVNDSAGTTADITPIALIGHITADNKTYDGTDSAVIATRTLDGVLGSEVVNYAGGTATFDDKNVGTGKAVTAIGLGLSGADAGNYTVNDTAGTTADITTFALTGHITADNKTYDGTDSAVIATRTLDGVFGSDNVSYVGGTATFDDKNVGTGKAVSADGLGLSGADAGNYSVNTSAGTTADITPVALIGHITADNKTYDGNDSAVIATRTLDGVLGTEVVSYTGGTATFNDKNVGTGKAVSAIGLGLSGADAGNYTVNDSAGTTADITPIALTGHITADNKTYDGTDSAVIATRTLDGVLGSEVVNYAGGTATFDDKNVGTGKAVSAVGLGLSGADAGNYTVNDTAGTTADIAARELEVTAVTDGKTYDGDASSIGVPTLTAGALQGSDTAAWTQSFDNKNFGTGKTITPAGSVSDGNSGNNYAVTFVADTTGFISKLDITVTAATDSKTYDGNTSSVGVPAITLGALQGTDTAAWAQTFDNKNFGTDKTLTPAGSVSDGNGGNNYAVTFVADTTGIISKLDITVTAATDSKTYDGNTSSVGVPAVTLGSLQGTDTAAWTQTFDNKNFGTGKTLTPAGSVSDGNGGNNYVVSFVTDTTGVISKRNITVTADAKTKPIGASDPALTYQITSGSLVSGDAFNGALSRAAGEAVGVYAISQNTLALSSNYNLTFIAANFTITDNMVDVFIGGSHMGSYAVGPSQSVRQNFGVDAGPVRVQSSSLPIIAAERDAWISNGVYTSFAQLMGLPASQLSDTYVFPAYNNVTLNEQLRIGNVDSVPTTVTVTIGGVLRGTYPLAANEAVRVNYAGVDSGPVIVQGTTGVHIIAAERDAWAANGTTTSFVQLMGLPAGQLSDTYVFPAYNNVTLNEQLRIANVDSVPSTVTVTIGGVLQGTYPLAANEAVRVNYAGLDSGPVIVKGTAGVHIIAAERDAWAFNGTTYSFAQLMGLPGGQLSDTYQFPAYNNVTLNEQLRIGNVDTVPTTVTVTIGGVLQGTYPLAANEAVRVNYAGLDSGPVVVRGTAGVHIIVAERDAWTANGLTTSWVQLMGLPAGSLSDTFMFPAYNDVTLNEQLRFGAP